MPFYTFSHTPKWCCAVVPRAFGWVPWKFRKTTADWLAHDEANEWTLRVHSYASLRANFLPLQCTGRLKKISASVQSLKPKMFFSIHSFISKFRLQRGALGAYDFQMSCPYPLILQCLQNGWNTGGRWRTGLHNWVSWKKIQQQRVRINSLNQKHDEKDF